MNELVLPVPKTVSATYIVPVPTPMNTAEARQKASTAVEARLTEPLRTLTATLTIPAGISGDITIGLTFKSWVHIHDVSHPYRDVIILSHPVVRSGQLAILVTAGLDPVEPMPAWINSRHCGGHSGPSLLAANVTKG